MVKGGLLKQEMKANIYLLNFVWKPQNSYVSAISWILKYIFLFGSCGAVNVLKACQVQFSSTLE